MMPGDIMNTSVPVDRMNTSIPGDRVNTTVPGDKIEAGDRMNIGTKEDERNKTWWQDETIALSGRMNSIQLGDRMNTILFCLSVGALSPINHRVLHQGCG